MKLIALMPVRSEGWVLGLSARAALRWCDVLILGMHACTDLSLDIAREIEREHPERVVISIQNDPEWHEMQHRDDLLGLARLAGATHIIICDADEVLTGNIDHGDPIMRQLIRQIPPGHILQLPGYNLRNGIRQYHANGLWGHRWFDVAFADDPALHWSGDRFHHRQPMGKDLKPYRPIQQGQGGILHLWGADERRLIAKHRAYRIQEALRWPQKSHAEIEAMYSMATDGRPPYDTPATWQFNAVPDSWWAPYADLMGHLHLDAEPWQERWCDEMIAQHGRERFAGLRV